MKHPNLVSIKPAAAHPVVPRDTTERHFPRNDGKYRAVTTLRGLKMPAIMSLEEPRPREPVVGERADRPRVLFPMQHLRRLSRRAGLRMGSGSRRPAAAPGARSRAVAQNGTAELHLNPFLCIAAGTIAGFPREVIGAGTMASGMCNGRQADQVPV